MANIWYVSKSGNNSNSGASYVLSKLTITGAIAVAASRDTIIVGSGLYNELLSVTNTLIFYADGNVILDGISLGGTLVNFPSGTPIVSFLPYSTGGTWTFQNSTGTYTISGTTNINYSITLKNCTLISNSNTYGVAFSTGGQTAITASYCVFVNFSTASIYSSNGNVATINIANCTFYNSTYAIYVPMAESYTGTVFYFYNNIFSNITTAIYINNSNTTWPTALNNNDYYSCTNFLRTTTGTYTTIAALQALGYGWEAQGMTTNPVFEDTANNILYPTVQLSPLLQIGAYPFSLIRGSNYNPDNKWNIIAAGGYDNTGWYNPDGNVTMVSNMFQLTSGSTGVIWSPVYDLGSSQIIQQFNIEGIQIWPSNMIDTTTTDVRPNYQTAEIRASATTFAQNNGVIAWTELKNKIDFITQGSTYMTGRYVQIRLTLQNADVAA